MISVRSSFPLVAALTFFSIAMFGSAFAAWETDTDRPGMNLRNFWINKDIEAFVAVKQCEDACLNDAQCKSFTYVKPGIQGDNARCYLKSGVPSATSNTCCTSGVVRPDTKSDYCKKYAIAAVQYAKNNKNWDCQYTGNRWSDDYKKHYGWCMNVPESSSKSETKERKRLYDECLEPSLLGDLSAHDWCYRLDKTAGKISFHPVIKNVGKTNWKSNKEGEYRIGISTGSIINENKYTLSAFPQWYLWSHKLSILNGATYNYHPANLYGIKHIWNFSHPEDSNAGNNSNSGFGGYYHGLSFENEPNLLLNQCAHFQIDAYWDKYTSASQLETHLIIKSISVIDEADGNGNAEPYLWPFFFKIDNDMMTPDTFYEPIKWSYSPGGAHGNIGKGYDTGHVRAVPGKYGHWKTTISHNPLYFKKGNVYVGAVVVLLEEDDLPSSSDVVSDHYPTYTNKITRRLQCKFLNSFNKEVKKLQSEGSNMSTLVKMVYDNLIRDHRFSELNCVIQNNPPSPGSGQGFGDFITEAEKEIQEEIISETGDPWYLNFFLPGISAFINIDDFIGAKIFIWKWTELEKDPFKTVLVKWNGSTGSEDGDFNMLMHLRTKPVF